MRLNDRLARHLPRQNRPMNLGDARLLRVERRLGRGRAGVADTAAITVGLPGVGHRNTIITRIPDAIFIRVRSEEHTSELQSRPHLVCRLLLEKKKKKSKPTTDIHNTTIQ